MHCGYCKQFSGTQSTLAKHFQKCAAALKEKVDKEGLGKEDVEKEAAKMAAENEQKQKASKSNWQASEEVKDRRNLNRYRREYRKNNPFVFNPPPHIIRFPKEAHHFDRTIWHVDLYNQLSDTSKSEVTAHLEDKREKIIEALQQDSTRKQRLAINLVFHPDKIPLKFSPETRSYIAAVQRELNNLMEAISKGNQEYNMSNGDERKVDKVRLDSHGNFAVAIGRLPNNEALRAEAEELYEETVKAAALNKLQIAKASKVTDEWSSEQRNSPPKKISGRKKPVVDLVGSDDDDDDEEMKEEEEKEEAEEEVEEKDSTHDDQPTPKRRRRAYKSAGGKAPRQQFYRASPRSTGGRRKFSTTGNCGRGGENDPRGNDDGGGKPRAKTHQYPKDY